jgi:uroporphyrinogen-III synthase
VTPTVLNTRPREQAAELSHLLRAAGLEVIEAPAIETASAWDPGALQAVRVDLAARLYAWVMLPSSNAGRALVDELRQPDARLVCGAGSARALGLTPEFRLDRFSAAAALELVRPLVRPGQRILVPRAAEGSPELIDGLDALGARVYAPIAYRTLAVEPAALADAAARLRNHAVDAITVCSPSALSSLLAAIDREALSSARLICLGATTAAAAREAGLNVDAIAARTSMAALVEAVIATLDQPAVPLGAPSGVVPA